MSGDLSRHPMFAKRHTAYNPDEPPPPLLSALNHPPGAAAAASDAAAAAPLHLSVNSQPQHLSSPVGSSVSAALSPSSAASGPSVLSVSPSGPPLPSSAPTSRPSLPRATPAVTSAAPQRASLGSPAAPLFPVSPTSPAAAASSASGSGGSGGVRMPVAQPVVFASGAAPQGHPMFASSASSSPLPFSPSPSASSHSFAPSERVLAIQTSARSSPAPASSQLSPTGQSAVVFSGSGGSSAAQPVQLRDPAELVQRATSDSLRGVSDWGLNMRVVDLVNNSPDKADYILQSLMPRLLSKDHAVGLTALALLESLVKNCPSTHQLVGRRAVLDGIVQLLPVRIRDPEHKHPFSADHTNDVLGMERYDRILVVIQLWGKSFAYNPKAPAFMEVYKELLNKGVKFAQPDRDELAPVFTPPPNSKLLADRVAGIASSRSSRQGSAFNLPSAAAVNAASPASSAPSSNRSSLSGGHSSSGLPAASASSSSSSSSSLADPPLIYTTVPSFRDAELNGAWEQVKLLLEMLDNSDTAEAVAQDEIVNMLVKDLRKAQESILAKLHKPTVNDRVDHLLACNDILVNTFAYYDGLSKGTMRRRNAQDEARRAAAEEDLVFSERPHVRRANSYTMESHDVRLVRDSQDPHAAVHQYNNDAEQPSFSYAVPSMQPSPSHARSPSAGESATASSAGLGTLLTQQPMRAQPQSTAVPAVASSQPRGERSPVRTQPTAPAAYTPEPYRMEASQPNSGSSSAAPSQHHQQLHASNPQKSRSPSPVTPRSQPSQQSNIPQAPPAATQPAQQQHYHTNPAPTMPAMPTMPTMSAAPVGAPSPFAPFPVAMGGPGAASGMPAMSPEQYTQWMAFMQQQMAMMQHAMMQQQQQQPYQPAPYAPQAVQGEAGGAGQQSQGEPAQSSSALGEQGEQAQGERGGEGVEQQFGQMRLDSQRK